MDNFLDRFIEDPRRRAARLHAEKNAVRADRYDRTDAKEVFHDMHDLQAADDRLCGITDTGHHALEDVFFSAAKGDPRQHRPDEMMPKFLVNREVNRQAMDLKDMKELRSYTVGDIIGSALAAIAIEPDLEIIFDKLKEEQKLADKMQQQMEQMQGMQQQDKNLDEMFQEWMDNGGDAEDPDAQEPRDYQQAKELLAQQAEALQQQYDENEEKLKEALDRKKSSIQQQLKEGIEKATGQAEQVEAASMLWGTERGQLHHLSPKERIEFAKKVDTPKFRRIAELIGPLTRLALAEQSRKTDYGREEIFDVTFGNDLARVLPGELADLRHPQRKFLFMKKFMQGNLLQYDMRGTERVAKGGIIFCEDGSGSMSGDREIWAKAVGLALYQIARKQKRSFYAIHFGGPREIRCYDFRDPKEVNPDKVLDFASTFFGGGTDFMTPLSKALDLLTEEFNAQGCVKGDIVFATDGQCGVDDDWLKKFRQEKDRLGFRVFGISIGGSARDEPLATICDKRVCTVKNLVSGDDVRDVFRAV